LSSKTSEIQAVIVEKHTCLFPPSLSWDTRLVLVDTPGFNRGSDVRADPNLMDDITTWFRDSYVRSTPIRIKFLIFWMGL
jgi:hypothetical protein